MKKKFIIGILIILIIIIIAVSTLALFTWTSPNTTLTLEVGEMTDVIFQEGNDIIANNIGPVLNYEDGEITEFAIINNAENEQQAKFYLDISEISDSLKEESFKYLLQTSTDGTNYDTYKEGNFVSATTGELIISEDEILPNGRTYYRFIIYIDGNMENPTSMMNNSLKATFNVELPPPTITVSELVDQMKANANSGTPDFSQVATTDEGIYAAQDDYGTSYYFRGAVENNYVQFAGYYWRIIRANGDGTLRLIYDGTSAHANGEESVDRKIGASVFNTSNNDNAYVGYMYGQAGASSYDETHANVNDSNIKTYVDNWYKTNIQDVGYSDKVADAIYCNDRSVSTYKPYSSFNNLGYGRNDTYYMAGYRLYINKSPILTCSQQNDAFTVNDITKGNGALTYPVGLITADEVSMGGGDTLIENSSYYLYAGGFYWTMSPSIFYSSNASEWYVPTTGVLSSNNYVDYNFSVRPVLSLKSSVELQGTGTMNDPYVVQD